MFLKCYFVVPSVLSRLYFVIVWLERSIIAPLVSKFNS